LSWGFAHDPGKGLLPGPVDFAKVRFISQ